MLKNLPAYPLFSAFYCLLISLMCSESLLFTRGALPWGPLLVVTLLKVFPLLAFSPWLWRRGSGSVLGLSLMLLPYFCLGVLAAMTPGMAGAFAVLRCLFIAGLFTACMLVVKTYGSSGTARS